MTEEQIKTKAKEQLPNDEFKQQIVIDAINWAIAELEKENAELKKKNLDTQDAVTMQMYTNKANKEIADKQLTKAKEIIKKMIEAIHIWDCKNLEEVEAEAEQFLNSEVEK